MEKKHVLEKKEQGKYVAPKIDEVSVDKDVLLTSGEGRILNGDEKSFDGYDKDRWV